jgi:hypothetical protein
MDENKDEIRYDALEQYGVTKDSLEATKKQSWKKFPDNGVSALVGRSTFAGMTWLEIKRAYFKE